MVSVLCGDIIQSNKLPGSINFPIIIHR